MYLDLALLNVVVYPVQNCTLKEIEWISYYYAIYNRSILTKASFKMSTFISQKQEPDGLR